VVHRYLDTEAFFLREQFYCGCAKVLGNLVVYMILYLILRLNQVQVPQLVQVHRGIGSN
jgi:hypothetical protein